MTNYLYRDMRFLIVDNIKPSQDILKQFAMRLTTQQVDSSHYAQDVISICQQKKYDVILLGYDLGDNQKNGQQILEELRVNNFINRHCIIILITAEISQEMVLAALEHKPDDYLCKPYSLNTLDRRLSNCLKKKRAMSSIYGALELGDTQLVIEYCNIALANNTPYKTECLGIKSRQFFELAQFKEAKEIYLAYNNTRNCQWANIGLGKIALHEQKLANAEAIFKSVIKDNPYYLSSYDWLAVTYQEQFNLLFAEEILEQALQLSPRSIPRLKKYAQLCLDNDHFDKATFAYEQTYKLAQNSIHHCPDNAVMFVKALIEYSPSLTIVEAKKMNRRAFKYLKQMNREFCETELRIHSHLLSACLLETTQEFSIANEELKIGKKLLAQEKKNIPENKLGEISQTLTKLKRHVTDLDISITSQEDDIDTSTTQDTGHKIRNTAQAALEQALKLYESKQYDLAIEQLTNVQQLYPDHLGIKLNLLQILLASYEKDKKNYLHFRRAKKILVELKIIKESQKEYSRLNKMQKKYQLLAGI